MAHWILQSNSEAGYARLVDALQRLELSYSEHKVVPFSRDLVPEVPPPKGPVIVMGTTTLARIARERRWYPGAWMNENFDFEKQWPIWHEHMLNCHAWVGRLADVPHKPVPFFIRPTDDSKAFTGQVMSWESFSTWRDGVLALSPEDGRQVSGDTRVLVAMMTKEIYGEYRTWVVDGQVVTASQYKLGSRPLYKAMVDERVTRFASDMAALWRGYKGSDLAPAYCLDVFDTCDGLRVGEVNCINSAGFYEADMMTLVMALDRRAR